MEIDDIVRKALEEDLGEGDHTSLATIPGESRGTANLSSGRPASWPGSRLRKPYSGRLTRRFLLKSSSVTDRRSNLAT